MDRKHILILITLAASVLSFGRVYPDSGFYLEYAKAFAGQGPFPQGRIDRFFIPLLAAPLTSVLPVEQAFGVVNTLLLIGLALASFRLYSRFLKDNQPFFASALTVLSIPILIYGASPLLDTGVYFLNTVLLLLFLDGWADRPSPKALAFLALALLNIFTKSYPVIPLFLVAYSFFQKSWPPTRLAIAAASIIIPALLFGGSYSSALSTEFQWRDFAGRPLLVKAGDFFSSYFAAFGLLVLLIPFAIRAKLSKEALLFHKSFAIPTLLFFFFYGLAAESNSRYTFILFPSFIPFALIALSSLKEKHKLLTDRNLLVACALVNIAIALWVFSTHFSINDLVNQWLTI